MIRVILIRIPKERIQRRQVSLKITASVTVSHDWESDGLVTQRRHSYFAEIPKTFSRWRLPRCLLRENLEVCAGILYN